MPVPESLPVSDADVDTFAGNFPMGDVWEGLEDVDKVAYNTLVLGLWRSLRWRQSPFDDTDEGNEGRIPSDGRVCRSFAPCSGDAREPGNFVACPSCGLSWLPIRQKAALACPTW